MHPLARRLSLSTVAALAACAPQPEPPTRPELPSRTWLVDGTTLRDALGRQILARGVAVGGRSKLPPFFPFDVPEGTAFEDRADAFFGRVSALGANSVRLAFPWEAIEPERGAYDDAWLARYVAMMDAAHAHDLAVIVELHQDLFARPICGDGAPLWAVPEEIVAQAPVPCPGFPTWGLAYFDPESPANLATQRLWDDEDGLRASLIAAWRHVAAATADHPALAAYEPYNEPPAGTAEAQVFERETLPSFYAEVGAAIREVAGPGPAILLDGRAGDAIGTVNVDFARPDLDGVAYAPHYYDAITVGLNAPVVDGDNVARAVGDALSLARSWGSPGVLGEFGAQNSNPVKGEYLARVYDALDLELAHGMLWDVTWTAGPLWNDEDFSALDADGNERAWVADIDRPAPRAVAGSLREIAWDAESGEATLVYDGATDGVTEIYLPSRHLGDAPAIDVEGATAWAWDPPTQTLLVSAEPGAKVVVRATAASR